MLSGLIYVEVLCFRKKEMYLYIDKSFILYEIISRPCERHTCSVRDKKKNLPKNPLNMCVITIQIQAKLTCSFI